MLPSQSPGGTDLTAGTGLPPFVIMWRRWSVAFPRSRSDHMARGDLEGAVLEVAAPLVGPRDGQQSRGRTRSRSRTASGNRDLARTRVPAALLRHLAALSTVEFVTPKTETWMLRHLVGENCFPASLLPVRSATLKYVSVAVSGELPGPGTVKVNSPGLNGRRDGNECKVHSGHQGPVGAMAPAAPSRPPDAFMAHSAATTTSAVSD